MFKNMFFVQCETVLRVSGGVNGVGDGCDSKSNSGISLWFLEMFTSSV